jgi:hypothetical protein
LTVTWSPSKSTVLYTSTHPTSEEVGIPAIQESRVDDAADGGARIWRGL